MTAENPVPPPPSGAETLRDQEKTVKGLKAQLARKNSEVQILRQISSELNSTLELDRILNLILDAMASALGFQHSMILLADGGGEKLRVAASRGYDDPGIGAEVPWGQGVVGVVAKRKRIMRMGNIQAQKEYLASVRARIESAGQGDRLSGVAKLPGLPDAQSQIGIPLLVQDRLIGVFCVESVEENAFNALDEVLLTIVANQVANAIDNAQLHEDVVERSRQLDAANAELSRLNATLEGEVQTRTAELSRALEAVRREKELSEDLLKRMAPPAVIPLMLEDKLTPRRLRVTVLFSDLESFTEYSSRLEPDEIFARINDYFSAAGEIIHRYRGYVNKTNGDNIMALFGVPFESATHHTDAVLAALAMQSELRGQFPFNIRIGLNTGTVAAGMLGPRNKSLYDVLGDVVNVASRMEEICPPGGVAASSELEKAVSSFFVLESLGAQQVKGKGAMDCLNVVRLRELAEDPRRVDPSSRFAGEFLRSAVEAVDAVKGDRLGMVDFPSVQARDGALGHNEAVAACALSLLRLLRSGDDGAGWSSVDEGELVQAALVHDIGKRKLDAGRLNDPSPAELERDTLRRDLLEATLETLEQIDLGALAPRIRELYRFEASRGAEGEFGPETEVLAAADIYDALTAPKSYKGRPWSIVGTLAELLSLPYCRARKRPAFEAFVALMKPRDADISARSDSRAILR